MKRILFSIGAFVALLLLFWIGGLDYNKRGILQAYSILVSSIVALFCYTSPIWSD